MRLAIDGSRVDGAPAKESGKPAAGLSSFPGPTASAQLLKSEVIASWASVRNSMDDYTTKFTEAELERLLDWFQELRLCHGDVPGDYVLSDKIAFELSKLRRPVEQP